jgi:hydrogenase-4 component E
MSNLRYQQLLDLAVGGVLAAAMLVLWRRTLRSVVRVLAAQGVCVAAVAVLIGVHGDDIELVVVGAVIVVVKGVVVPRVLRRAVVTSGEPREIQPLVNVAASLLTAAAITLLVYATTLDVVALAPSPTSRALPIGLAVVLIGFFVLTTRRKAVSQVVGFVLVDNGITLVALLATAGIPFVVELGASLDLLIAVVILQVLAARMQLKFGATDLDQLRELRD